MFSPPAKKGVETNATPDLVCDSNDSSTVVGSSEIDFHNQEGELGAPDDNGVMAGEIMGNSAPWGVGEEARGFANHVTANFRQRLAEDFVSDAVLSLDDYSRMGELGSMENALWEHEDGRRRREREQWRDDTGFWAKSYS